MHLPLGSHLGSWMLRSVFIVASVCIHSCFSLYSWMVVGTCTPTALQLHCKPTPIALSLAADLLQASCIQCIVSCVVFCACYTLPMPFGACKSPLRPASVLQCIPPCRVEPSHSISLTPRCLLPTFAAVLHPKCPTDALPGSPSNGCRSRLFHAILTPQSSFE